MPSTRIETRAFEVEGPNGLRSILIQTCPLRIDDNGHATPLPMGSEFRLRNGQSVVPLSEREFLGPHGQRWHRVD